MTIMSENRHNGPKHPNKTLFGLLFDPNAHFRRTTKTFSSGRESFRKVTVHRTVPHKSAALSRLLVGRHVIAQMRCDWTGALREAGLRCLLKLSNSYGPLNLIWWYVLFLILVKAVHPEEYL